MTTDPAAESIARSWHRELPAPDNENNVDPVNLDPVPSDLPEDTKYLGDRLDKIAALLADLEQATVRNQVPAPGAYFVLGTHNDFPQNVRLRVTDLVVSVSGTSTISLRIGSAIFVSFTVSANELTKVIPLPIVIDAGTDVVVAATGGATINTAFLLGYPESDRPRV